jgi:DNA polymerase-4/protein ImuB
MDYVCALVPRFLASLARRDNAALLKRPVIIGRSSETRGTVVEASVEAARAGVVPGMQITRALVLCPSAAVVAMREDQFVAAGREFQAILEEHSPAVEEVEPGHLHADVRGLARLAGLRPQEYIAQLQETLAGKVRLPVQVGSAATVFVAHAAAAYLAKPAIAVEGPKAGGLLAPLPVDVLPVSAEMLRRLGLFGIERLEQLGALPPAALQAQFGREGLLAWRLIHGEEAGRVIAARDELRVVERMELPAPAVISTPMVLATEILFQRGLRRPEIGGRSLRRADWVAELENEERMPLRLVYQEPTSDLARMLFVARNAIERLELPAPAIAIELTLSGICSEYARQERLWRTGPRGQEALGEAVEQLNTRTGAPQIYRVVEVEPWSRIPERQRALAAYYP